MITRLAGGRIYDPVHGKQGEIQDLFVENGRVVAAAAGMQIDHRYDVSGQVVMAGALDIHSHIAGGKVNLARLLMTEDHRSDVTPRGAFTRAGRGLISPSS